MRVAICDDDRDARVQAARLVRDALERRGTAAEAELFADAAALLAARTAGQMFEAYFLDVLMPGMDGMALAEEIRKTQPAAPIVFLTTSEDYALQAFSLDAAHYVLKPPDAARFATAVDRLLALMPKPQAATLVVRTAAGEMVAVPLAQIVLAESAGHYQKLLLADGRKVCCRHSGVELWEKLSASGGFALAHRGAILGVRHVRSLAAGRAVMANGDVVPVSRRALPEFKKAFFRFNCR